MAFTVKNPLTAENLSLNQNIFLQNKKIILREVG